MTTIQTIFKRHAIQVPIDLQGEIEVPVLSGTQRQGDIFILPRQPMTKGELELAVQVPKIGLSVVVGEATGNAHMLSPEPGSKMVFLRKSSGLILGVFQIFGRKPGWMIHTDEHGANGFVPGCYTIHGKREQREEIERVQD